MYWTSHGPWAITSVFIFLAFVASKKEALRSMRRLGEKSIVKNEGIFLGCHYWLSFPPIFGIWANCRCLSSKGPINFLDPSLEYIKLMFPISKQFRLILFLIGKTLLGSCSHLYPNSAPHSLVVPTTSPNIHTVISLILLKFRLLEIILAKTIWKLNDKWFKMSI